MLRHGANYTLELRMSRLPAKDCATALCTLAQERETLLRRKRLGQPMPLNFITALLG
jgi:hypothetical protein